eukprot:GFYU01003582.1.p1 GENE.GFYU01003582.1~~GFYU01003582.1.p1  ORF type:complete len:162 (-),score=48.62 GFYU01003582.1:247-732(-)
MGRTLMGTGESDGANRARDAAHMALANPLLGNVSIENGSGVLISISGGSDLTLFEVDEISNTVRDMVHPDANIIFGSTFDPTLEGKVRVSIIVTGLEAFEIQHPQPSSRAVVNREAPVHTERATPGSVARAGAVNSTAMSTHDIKSVVEPVKKKSFWQRHW